MTPQWLQKHATLSHFNASSPVSLHFTVNQEHARLIRVPLFLSGTLPTDDIVITVTVHLEDPPTPDSDLFTTICDDAICNGIWISDSRNYPDDACNYFTVNSGVNYTFVSGNTAGGSCGAPINYTFFPNTVTLTFYPTIGWASFSIPPSGGYTTAGTFSGQLNLTKGLYLEVYGGYATEHYKLQFMEATVTKN